ncbi:MAG: ThiF family adenylyltransferase [Proteobacteria bacterium]|nr:ThiF family adenylyltransferase [Pseudomonadota bacterium]
MALAGVPRALASSARLLSREGFARLRTSTVAVVGVGGVGAWAAEALARSGVQGLVLIDMDHVAESNLNRQVQATHQTLGQAKVQAMADRLRSIAPTLLLYLVDEHLTPENVRDLVSGGTGATPQVWIDACDDRRAKAALVLALPARTRPRSLVVIGGAGGKLDPTRIRVGDLADAKQDPLLSKLRYSLRRQHDFPRTGTMRVRVVSSDEPARATQACDPAARLACAGYGSMVTVTASMGMAAAAETIRLLTTG